MICCKCGKKVHWCPSCGLSPSEEAPYEYDLCDDCFKKSGAKDLWDKKYSIEHEIDEKISNYTFSGNEPPSDNK